MNYLLANTSLFSYIMLVFLSSCCYNSNNESIYIDYATLKPDITSRNNHIDNDCTYWIDENYGDDDDDDEQSPILPNERQQEFRTLMEELGNQCNCTIPEYNQIDEFISTKMEKTTFYRNLLTLTSIINNDNLWVLKHIFVFCPFIPFDNFLPTDNETLCFAIPPELLHSISLKKCLFNSGRFTLSTIAVFKNRENDETRVVVISNNDGNIYYDSLNDFKPITCPDKIITDSSIMTSITAFSSAICKFEKKSCRFWSCLF